MQARPPGSACAVTVRDERGETREERGETRGERERERERGRETGSEGRSARERARESYGAQGTGNGAVLYDVEPVTRKKCQCNMTAI